MKGRRLGEPYILHTYIHTVHGLIGTFVWATLASEFPSSEFRYPLPGALPCGSALWAPFTCLAALLVVLVLVVVAACVGLAAAVAEGEPDPKYPLFFGAAMVVLL
jgi:hypothetical protein